MQSREVHLASRPAGEPTSDNFKLVSVDVAAPAAGEVQVRNLYMSVDPAMRGRMHEGRSYVPPYELNKVMEGPAIGVVVASNDPGFKPGDHVNSDLGWREVFNAPASKLTKLDLQGLPPPVYMNLLGLAGKTAYVGMMKIAGLRDGDVVFVSAAAGSVGSIAAQIAKARGHTVIGSAGGAQKVAFLKEIGLDAVIDYKAEAKLTKALAALAPKGIDVYFDNVGGDHLQAAIAVANKFARFAVCGMISQYNDAGASTGPRNLTQIMGKCIRIEGYLVREYLDQIPDFEKDMVGWYRAGKLKTRETIYDGVDNAANAFLGMMRGENIGKMMVRLADA
ncbi:MAG: NADP-dependent oxidoreductase [Hyphomonadaceae bacterium]